MNSAQNAQCNAIIHSAAVTAAVGNAAPLPGVGLSADTLALIGMVTAIAAIFGQDIDKSIAKAMAITALKRQVLRQPIKILSKELSKIIPGLGQIVAPAVSFGLIETVGWELAREFENNCISISS